VEKVEVVIATRNAGKLREIQEILALLGLKVLSLRDFPEIPEILEDGQTFQENAVKKAAAVAHQTGRVAIADDSGLAVDALQGRPGVFSSRYAGENATDADRYRKLLKEMADVPEGKRGAAFICTVAVASPSGKVGVVEGECRGEIALAPKGSHGFGYDPVFYFPEAGKTMAELEPEVKNRFSHRARALEKLKQVLPKFLKNKINNKSPMGHR
jgi:XTP/dITP diphosphohydrolase